MKNMKIYKFLLAFLVIIPFLQSCQEDISSLEDPRDAIAKEWEVTEDGYIGGGTYRVTIIKDGNEKTRILFGGVGGFHNLQTTPQVYATIAGLTLTIPTQTAEGNTFNGTGVISANFKNIDFNYTITTLDGTETFHSNYGPVITVKKKNTKVTLPLPQ